MIELTRLNGNPLYVNCDLIKWAEAAPDTLLTLISGEKVVVRESCEELVERIRHDRFQLLSSLMRLTPGPEHCLRAITAASLAGPGSRANPEELHEDRPRYLGDDQDQEDQDDEAAETG